MARPSSTRMPQSPLRPLRRIRAARERHATPYRADERGGEYAAPMAGKGRTVLDSSSAVAGG
ncbi:hypothetical protein [Embleya sp. NPDC005575]|uniref:hypothetical protein n=1 Tax=Embleya sp. NPDC005575 TaxID=3156892 RepID=UPI0033AB6C9A